MTIYYSKSTNGFYDNTIHLEIPADAKEISEETHRSLIADQLAGLVIQPDKKGKPVSLEKVVSKEDKIKKFESVAKKNMESIAKSWGYASISEAISYSSSTNEKFKAEADMLNAWRDETKSKIEEIKAGELPANVDLFLALLPAAPIKP